MLDHHTHHFVLIPGTGEEANQQREMSELFKSRGYIKSASSKELSPEDEKIVSEMVEARVQAKKDRNFNMADDIRDQLIEEYDVYIQDKAKIWSVGGDFTAENGGIIRNESLYQRVGGGEGTLTEEDLSTISELVWNRAKAKKSRNYSEADGISDHLYEKYSVRTDDNNKIWWIETEGYTQEPPTSRSRILTEEELAAVDNLLKERLQLKNDRMYDAADEIRDELLDVYSVMVNDRTRSFRTLEDDSYAYGDSTEAAMSESRDVVTSSKEFEDTEDVTESEISESPLDPSDLSTLTVPELKEKLRALGKPVSGKKAELIERILS